MTDQVDDQFEYQGNSFAIADYSAGIAFHPGILGMAPDPVSTDCWRGYQVTYGLSSDHLQVIRLGVNLVVDTKDYERVEGPVIGGVRPVESIDRYDDFNNNYQQLQYSLDYTGRMLLGKGFIEEFYDELTPQNYWAYEELLELKFSNGLLGEVVEHTEKLTEIRALAAKQNAVIERLFEELNAALKAGKKDLRDEIKERYRARMKCPPPGEDYEAQIKLLVKKSFAEFAR